jgi:hypothetical protein
MAKMVMDGFNGWAGPKEALDMLPHLSNCLGIRLNIDADNVYFPYVDAGDL